MVQERGKEMCFLGADSSRQRQQALSLLSLSQNPKDKLWSQSVNSSLARPVTTARSTSISTHTHAHARTPALKYGHQSPGVCQSKCVLASRAQQGRIKKKEKQLQQLFCLCVTFLQLFGLGTSVLHPFILHLSGKNTDLLKSRKVIFVFGFGFFSRVQRLHSHAFPLSSRVCFSTVHI